MNRYTIKLIIRSWLKNRVLTALNLIGLTIGISSFLILFLHVANEKSYDKHFTGYETIFRATSTPLGQENTCWAVASALFMLLPPASLKLNNTPNSHMLPLEP